MTSAIFPTPETARRLEALLWSRLQGRVRTLRVLVRDNGLVLQGCANSWYGKCPIEPPGRPGTSRQPASRPEKPAAHLASPCDSGLQSTPASRRPTYMRYAPAHCVRVSSAPRNMAR
jgi:hypothetical protein